MSGARRRAEYGVLDRRDRERIGGERARRILELDRQDEDLVGGGLRLRWQVWIDVLLDDDAVGDDPAIGADVAFHAHAHAIGQYAGRGGELEFAGRLVPCDQRIEEIARLAVEVVGVAELQAAGPRPVGVSLGDGRARFGQARGHDAFGRGRVAAHSRPNDDEGAVREPLCIGAAQHEPLPVSDQHRNAVHGIAGRVLDDQRLDPTGEFEDRCVGRHRRSVRERHAGCEDDEGDE